MLRVGIFALAILAFAPATSLAASKIGIAGLVQNEVNATLGADTRALRLGNDVFAGDRIRTGQSSNTQLMFLDQTNLTVGSQSDVVLDRFVFDPNRGAGNVVMSTTQGALRFISGSQSPNTYRVETPAATIAIRGTLGYVFLVRGAEYIVNGFGRVGTIIKATGATIDIPQGSALVILPDGAAFLIKWDLGMLDLDRLAQLLPLFVDPPDGAADLSDAHDAAKLPPFIFGGD